MCVFARILFLHDMAANRKLIGSAKLNKKEKATEQEQSRKSVQTWKFISRFHGDIPTNTRQPYRQTKQRSLQCQRTVSNNTCGI